MTNVIPLDRFQLDRTAAGYAVQSLSPSTLRGYRAAWRAFQAWCRAAGCKPLPATPETVANYLASLAPTHRHGTLAKALSAIGQYHRVADFPFDVTAPAIRHTLRGIARQHGKPTRQSAALTTAEIKRLVATCGTRPADLRDRALLLLGYAGALRRSELVAVDREHLTFTAEGLRLLIPRSKTDATGKGAEVGIPFGSHPETCPVRALQAWLGLVGDGPVFRKVSRHGPVEQSGRGRLRDDAVRKILLRRAAMAGLTVPDGERLSPHGLRSGFITEAYKAGARDEEIMQHTRHRDVVSMRGYIRRAGLIIESPAKKLGL